MTDQLSQTEVIRQIAEATAEAAVNKTLLRLGLDPEDLASFQESRADFAYLRRLRLGSDLFKKQGITTVASVLTTFIIGAIVAAAFKFWPHFPS